MTALKGWASQAGQIGKARKPPGEAIRGPSRSFDRPRPRANGSNRPKPDLHDLASGWSDRLEPAIRIGLTPPQQSPARSVCRGAPWPHRRRHRKDRLMLSALDLGRRIKAVAVRP